MEEACKDYDRGISLEPRNRKFWLKRAHLKRDLGMLEESLADFRESIRLEHRVPEAWSARGNLLKIMGRFEEALLDFEQLIKLKPRESSFWGDRSEILRRLGGRLEDSSLAALVAYLIDPKSKGYEETARKFLGINKDFTPETVLGLLPQTKKYYNSLLEIGQELLHLNLLQESLLFIETAIKMCPQKAAGFYIRA